MRLSRSFKPPARASDACVFRSSRDIGRSDTLDGAMARGRNKRQLSDPTLLIKKALKGAQKAAQTATTVIGTVASEIAGERVLQPNSPSSMVTSALQSANKTKQLARRIYYSFAPQYRDGMVLADISRCFRSREEAERVRRRLSLCAEPLSLTARTPAGLCHL